MILVGSEAGWGGGGVDNHGHSLPTKHTEQFKNLELRLNDLS